MTRQEAIDNAIAQIKGQEIKLGRIVASKHSPLTWKLLRYESDKAICCIKPEEEVSFPRADIFDVKKLTNVANHLLNLGFWEEGMESMTINFAPQ